MIRADDNMACPPIKKVNCRGDVLAAFSQGEIRKSSASFFYVVAARCIFIMVRRTKRMIFLRGSQRTGSGVRYLSPSPAAA